MPAKSVKKKNLSAIKRARQAEKLRLRNKSIKTAIKNITKKVETAVGNKNKEEVKRALLEAKTVISKAASKGIIHKNTASRKVSRLAKIANTILISEAA